MNVQNVYILPSAWCQWRIKDDSPAPHGGSITCQRSQTQEASQDARLANNREVKQRILSDSGTGTETCHIEFFFFQLLSLIRLVS